MMSRHVASALALCLTASWCAASFAQPSGGAATGAGSAADNARKREADARFVAGVKLHNDGKEADARVQFEQANALRPNNVNILFNLARTEQLTGERLGALRHYRACLADASHLKPGLRELAEKGIEELGVKLGHVKVDVPEGASDVTVDDVPIAYGEVLDVLPGEHVAAARSASGLLMRTPITVTLGATVTASFAAGPKPSPVVTTSAATDAATPQVSAAPPATDSAAPSAAAPPVKWVVVGSLGALAVASVVVAVGFNGAAHTASDDVASLQAEAPICSASAPSAACSALAEALDRRDRDANLRTGFFVGAGVLAAGAIASAVFWPHEAPTRSGTALGWHLRPEAPGTQAGASLFTHF